MIGFIVPFKSKIKSKDWINDCSLLKQTLKSICNQTNDKFIVIVVYTDYPDTSLLYQNEKIQYLQFPFEFVKANEIDDYEEYLSKHFPDDLGEFMFDHGRRIFWGFEKAIEEGCNFIMPVDADDLISNKIAQYVNINKNEKLGWYINKGYILKKKNKFLIKVKKDFNSINGTSHIINSDIIPRLSFSSKKLSEFIFFSAHGYLRDRIYINFSDNLKPLPFFGTIYLVHNYNNSKIYDRINLKNFKTIIKYIVRGKFLSAQLKQEFGLE